MKLVTKRNKIIDVLYVWKKQYPEDKTDKTDKKSEVCKKLEKLNLSIATEFDVNNAIGNSSWTSLDCNVCKEDSKSLIVFQNYEDEFEICKSCLERAFNKINQ